MTKSICIPSDDSPTGWRDLDATCEYVPAEPSVGLMRGGYAIDLITDDSGRTYNLADFTTGEVLDILEAIQEA